MSRAAPANSLPIAAVAASPRPAPARLGLPQPLRNVMPLAALFYSFLLFSPEVAVVVGGINLPSYRIALLILALPAVVMVIKRPEVRFHFIDVAVAIASFWMMLSFMLHYGFQNGLIRGGGLFVDTALSYLVARASVARFDELRYLLMILLPGLMLAGFLLALESLSGRLVFRPIYVSLFGNVRSAVTEGGSVTGLDTETRLGLMRAYGPFEHPILAGVFMASFLPLYWFSGLRSWPFWVGLAVTLTAIFSLSSGAFLCLFIALGAIGVNRLKLYMPQLSWWTVSAFTLLVLTVAHIASQNGIISVLSRVTLTPHTADYRVLIWRYGWNTIENFPWFGIGYKSWERLPWMHDSVDAHFLLLGMRHGVMVPVILTAAILYGLIRLGSLSSALKPQDKQLAIGINISIVMLFVVGQTVAFFGSGTIAFMIFLALLAAAVGDAHDSVTRERLARALALRQQLGPNFRPMPIR